MDLRFSAEDEAFRAEAREWLADNLIGEFADARGLGGSGSEHEGYEVRSAWERHLGKEGWTCLGWPVEFGGRAASLTQQVIWAEEYARADAPARVNHMGENLLGPTLIEFGTAEQQERFLPGIVRGEELWCQGYSEPDAGSDLANVKTRATRARGAGGPRGSSDEWSLTGQKVWTSLAQWAQWCFVVARTDPDVPKHKGLSFFLVPMDQPGVEIRPIIQLTGTAEFNEVFFDDARTAATNIVGQPGDGWKVAMGLLGFERGVSTLAQQIGFQRELDRIVDLARANGKSKDPVIRQRLADAYTGLRLLRFNALRTMSSASPGPEASISKLHWATWHCALGELAVDVVGLHISADERLERLFLFTRADTIYGGSNEIQRNIIGERVLGLPKEPSA